VALDIASLPEAEVREVRMDGQVTMHVWHAEAHGVHVSYQTADLTEKFWVSPIRTMREKGVALIDSSGQMVKHERKDR
jgi:hypothetical protein